MRIRIGKKYWQLLKCLPILASLQLFKCYTEFLKISPICLTLIPCKTQGEGHDEEKRHASAATGASNPSPHPSRSTRSHSDFSIHAHAKIQFERGRVNTEGWDVTSPFHLIVTHTQIARVLEDRRSLKDSSIVGKTVTTPCTRHGQKWFWIRELASHWQLKMVCLVANNEKKNIVGKPG